MSRLPGKVIGLDAIALLSPLTGIGQYTHHLARELREMLGEPPRLFYGAGWSEELRSTPMPTFAKGAKEAVARLIPRPYVLSRFLMQRKFDAGSKGLALYHEPNYLAFRFAGPTVVTVHDLSWVRFPEMHPPDRVRLMDSVMPRVAREAAHILVDSDFVRGEVLLHYGLPEAKVTTVRLGVAPEFTPRDASQTRLVLETHGLRHGEYVLAVGTLEPRKNLSAVLEAHAQLPAALRRRHPLAVVGMHGWGMERLPTRVREAVAAGEVRLLGYLPQDQMPMVYAGARVFAYPSIYEGFGLPPLEAMACGVPVIVSRRASLPELVEDAAEMVEPEDISGLSRLMGELLEDGARRQALALAGRARAATFTWQRCAAETVTVYDRVLT